MSAACVGVSAVATSNEPTSTPAKGFAIMISLPIWARSRCRASRWKGTCSRSAPAAGQLFRYRSLRPTCRSTPASGATKRVAPVAWVLQAEHKEHRCRRSVFQLRRQRNDILRLTRAHQYGDILLAIYCITYWRGIDAGADIEGPQFPERFRVVSAEAAVHVAEENQVSRRCQQTCIVRIGEFQCCLGLASGRIDRFDAAVETIRSLRSSAGEAVARLGRAALVRH